MVKTFLMLLLIIISQSSVAQDTVDVVEKTIKVGGFARETEYYGFAEGDKVIFNLIVENKKEIKDVTISEYPDIVRFADHTTRTIDNKVLNISRNGVYSFEYYNSNMSGRTIMIKIQRVPKSEATKFFNTNIKWVNKIDTTYSARNNTYLIGSDTSYLDILDSRSRVHSTTYLSGTNKTTVEFILPTNTVKWSYWIGVNEEGQEAYQRDQANFLKSGAKLLGFSNPLVGVALGLFSMSNANTGENIKYYILPTYQDVLKKAAGQVYMQYKKGDVVTDYGLMNFGTPVNTKLYIVLENDNLQKGIDVNVKILAVVVKNQYNTVVEKVPIYTNRSVPVIE